MECKSHLKYLQPVSAKMSNYTQVFRSRRVKHFFFFFLRVVPFNGSTSFKCVAAFLITHRRFDEHGESKVNDFFLKGMT